MAVEIYIARCNKGSGSEQHFGTMADAFLWAMRRASLSISCAVYKVRGRPASDIWEEPQLIATFGDMSKLDEARQTTQVT